MFKFNKLKFNFFCRNFVKSQPIVSSIDTSATPLWGLYSWKSKPIRHQPPYEDKEGLSKALKEIEKAPGIVEVNRIHSLLEELKECGEGNRMLVHLGDCSETFEDCNEKSITNRYVLYTICQMMMSKMLSKKITKIGRIAGQYAKPRSSPTEIVNGEEINSYFGDNVNEFTADKKARDPDPARLIKGYHWAVTTYHTINQLEGHTAGRGMFSSEKVGDESPINNIYKAIRDVLENQIRAQGKLDKDAEDYEDFMDTIKECADLDTTFEDLYISHEGLLLDYESRQTKLMKHKGSSEENHYNMSTHFLWVGERTNKYAEAHIEYFRGISNPIGMKCGPKSHPADIVKALKLLNPENELGKVSLIVRMGAKNVEDSLPPLIEEIVKNDVKVVWVCDAVHGNTYVND